MLVVLDGISLTHWCWLVLVGVKYWCWVGLLLVFVGWCSVVMLISIGGGNNFFVAILFEVQLCCVV